MDEVPSEAVVTTSAVIVWSECLSAAEALFLKGRLDECFELIQQLVANPLLPSAVLNNAGLLLQRLQKLNEADLVFEMAHKAEPLAEAPLVNRGSVLRLLGRWKEGLEVLLKGVQINPNSAAGWNNLGMLLRDMKQLPSAIKAFRRAVAAAPNWALAHSNLGTVFGESGDAPAARIALEKASLLSPESPQFFSNYLMSLNYLPEDHPGVVARAHGEYGKRFEVNLPRSFSNGLDMERPLRLGFVSGDFVDHSVGWFFEPLLKSLKGTDLQCTCFSNAPAVDAVTQRLRKHASGWVDLWSCDDEAAEALVRSAEIDVLIDLSGHTAGNRLSLFARRVAPIQMTMIGYLQTSGLRAMDFRITDAWLDPEKGEDPEGTERLIRLNSGAFGFRIPEGAPEVTALPPTDGGVIFGSFNSLNKLTPETVQAWSEVLKALPNSKLFVLASHADGLIAQLGAHGIPPERIKHSQRLPLGEFFTFLGGVHLALDTFPFNGLTVSLLAAWMGVPTVSLCGTTPHSRAGFAVANRLGFPELATSSMHEYVQKCVSLAGDLRKMSRMRGDLRARMLEGFGNPQRHAREFADAVRISWRQWCATQKQK